MPSSMIFVGLVVMWLLILVPAVARRRQEVARPSVTALSGRVLERTPRRDPVSDREPAGRDLEVDVRHELEPTHAGATRTEPERRTRLPAPPGEPSPRGRDLHNLDGWTWRDLDADPEPQAAPQRGRGSERTPGAPPRYRPGRGGYDPQAAAMAARARYAFRQRVVLFLLILAAGTAVAAVFTLPEFWWSHGAVDVALVGYLTYLRRQVRVEEAIRRRRSARVAAPHRAPDGETDEPASDRATERPRRTDSSSRRPTDGQESTPVVGTGKGSAAETHRAPGEQPEGDTSPVGPAVASPAIPKPAEPVESLPALPRLQPIPTPPVPIGTTLVEGVEDDPALHELESVTRPDYRRAAGQ